jgi:hypothetical protein
MVLAVRPAAPPLTDVKFASVVPGNTTALIKWKQQTGYPTIKWGIFYNNVNISGPLRVGTYTAKNLEPDKIYKMIVCSSLDGKTWTPGKKIQFRTKKIVASKTKVVKTKPKPVPKPPAPPRTVSKYSVSEVTNASVSQGSNGGTLTWSSQGQNVRWRITDGRGWLSPVLDTPTYTYLYEDLNNADLYIQSSDNNGVSWTLGTEVRSVIPDVDINDISVTYNQNSTATITYTKPVNKFQYRIIDIQPAPLTSTDGPIVLTFGEESTLQADGKYTYDHYTGTKSITIFAYLDNSYTYGTTVYIFYEDNLPAEVTDVVQTIRPDGSGVDVSFKGYANYYQFWTNIESDRQAVTTNTIFVPYSYTFTSGSTIKYLASAMDSSDFYSWTFGTSFELAFPQIKNVRAEPGPTSVRISWDPEITMPAYTTIKEADGFPRKWCIFGVSGHNDYNNPLIVEQPTIEIPYSTITPYSMIKITTNYAGPDWPLTKAFFYDPKPEPYEQASTDNTLVVLILLLILFWILKKNKVI